MTLTRFYEAVYVGSVVLTLVFIGLFIFSVIFYEAKLKLGRVKHGDDVRCGKLLDVSFFGALVFLLVQLLPRVIAQFIGVKL